MILKSLNAAVILGLLSASLVAQEVPQSMEERIARLEERAMRADALEIRVLELEGELSERSDLELEEALATRINALMADNSFSDSVKARHGPSVTIGGQVRQRAEYRTVVNYGAANPSDTDEDFVIQRTRVNFDVRLMDDFRVFVEFQDSRQWGEEMNVLRDLEGVDIHQAYADFEEFLGTPLTMRTGRMELSLWNQRLISPLDWHPVGRAWDGVQFFGEVTEGLTLEAGWHLIAEDPAIDSDADTDFYWTALTYKGVENHRFGAAFFWLHVDPSDTSFGTATIHAQGKFDAGFDYSIDLVAQFGDNRDQDVEAYASAVTFGYNFEGESKLRLGLEWTWASGDSDPNDDKFETFNPLFPFGHAYQGYLDIFAWQNGHDVAFHASFEPAKRWWAEIAVHGFWLDETEDSWYNLAGASIRRSPGARNKDIGFELDISVKHWFNDHVWIWFGYSHFFTGDYVDETGPSPDTDWFWLQLTATF